MVDVEGVCGDVVAAGHGVGGDGAFGGWCGGGGVVGVADVLGMDVLAVDVVADAVLGLPHDGQGPNAVVRATGLMRRPFSRIQAVPVSSLLPLSQWYAACRGWVETSPSCGRSTVTPAWTGPSPARRGPTPLVSVVWPMRMPVTSVMALWGPGVPVPTMVPASRARRAVMSGWSRGGGGR